MRLPEYTIRPLSEHSICVQFTARDELIVTIQSLAKHLRHLWPHTGLEVIPAYQSLTLVNDHQTVAELEQCFVEQAQNLDLQSNTSTSVHQIPVCYAAELAPDLAHVAKHNGLSQQQVIDYHCQAEYRVSMLGFLPGFVYLSGLNERLSCPRKATPELQIAPGSIGIGGQQTGVYSLPSPGGWQIIGRTAQSLFKPEQADPFVVQPLDRIRFVPISLAEYEREVQS